MTEDELHELAARHLDGRCDAAECARLEAELLRHADSRHTYLRHANLAAALSGHRSPAEDAAAPGARPRRVRWPAISAAAGLVAGLCTATFVWGVVSDPPTAAAMPVHALRDGSFDSGHLGAGFPGSAGTWSGDPARVERLDDHARHSALRFLHPAPDPNTPNGRAISCDIFQIVDLGPLHRQKPAGHEATLELAADMLDARPDGSPSITFICQLFLFSGRIEDMPKRWPAAVSETVASGAKLADSAGSASPRWQTLTARCILPDEADFAVIQIGARRNGPTADLGDVHADDVTLTLRTQPVLPLEPRAGTP